MEYVLKVGKPFSQRTFVWKQIYSLHSSLSRACLPCPRCMLLLHSRLKNTRTFNRFFNAWVKPSCISVSPARLIHRHYGSKRKLRDPLHREQQLNPTEDLYQRIVHADEHLIALSKPQGLSVYGSCDKTPEAPQGQDVKQTDIHTVAQSLPYLRDKLQSPELDIGLSLKSFYSGIVLLSRTKESKTKLDKSIALMVTQKQPFMTYLAVTVGVPQCLYGEKLTADIKRQHLHDREMALVCEKTSHSARKAGQMIHLCFTINPLVINEDIGAALVEVVLNKDKWEAVEVLMSHYLSPVLGDQIYSNRTITVSGVPFPTSAHAALPGAQRLPGGITKALESPTDLLKNIPLLVHRYKVVLSKFPSKTSSPLSLTATPSKDFMQILYRLGLYRDDLFTSETPTKVIENVKVNKVKA